MENTVGGRRRGTTRHSAEDQALDQIAKEAEARLAAKRQARAEAREIRMRELERQQREAEETADKVYDIYSTPDAVQRSSRVAAAIATPRSASVGVGVRAERDNIIRERDNNSYHSSRRSSEDSLEEATSLRDMRHELKEVEDKFRKAMIANAQLDNEKAAAAYQVELLKDRLEEMDENHSQLHREHRDKCRQFEALKRAAAKLQEDLEFTRVQLEERDRLIEEQGLVIVGGEYSSSGEDEDQQNDADHKRNKSSQSVPMKMPKRALVSSQVAEVLEKVGSGSLDVRLKKFVEQRNELLDELNRCKLELEEERARSRSGGRRLANGPLAAAGGVAAILDGSCATLLPDDVEEVQREANKLISDYKFRLQKADQDNSTLQATVARLESQVVRYKTAAEIAEKVEDDLKAEKRKLQREFLNSEEM